MERQIEILFVVLVFATCHLLAPWFFRRTERARIETSSFSGGLAAAYVCLHLLPEIHAGHEHMGRRIYFTVLLGITLFYGLEIWIDRRSDERSRAARLTLHLAASATYSFLLVYTLALQLPSHVGLTLVFAVSIGLHLLSGDLGLLELYQKPFERRGRVVLVGAVLAGYALSLVRRPSEVLVDAATAVLVGFMLFNVFRKELPEFRHARFRWFLLGITTLLGADLVLMEIND